MKKYTTLSLVFVAVIVAILAATSPSQSSDSRVKAFSESIKYENDKNYKKAIESLTKIYEQHKSDYLINLRLGWLNYQNKNYSESVKYYNKAKNIKPNALDTQLGITLPLSAQEKWSEVSAAYQAILKTDKNHYTANLRLGQIYLSGSDYQNAKKHLEICYSFYPGEYEPNLSLGWTYYYLGDKAKAKELLTNALMLNPGDELAKQGLDLIK